MRADNCSRAILLLPIVATVGVHAQQTIAPGTESFEVASVKVNKSGAGRTVRIGNAPLGAVLIKAYNIYLERQLSNPASFSSILIERYDVDAKAAHPAGNAEMLRMLQGLLTDRFKLAMHTEAKEISGYALVVDAAGQKMHRHAGEGGDCEVKGGKDGAVRFQNFAMNYLASFVLSGLTDKPVAGNTGLKGGYDFELHFSRAVAANPDEDRPTATVLNPDNPSIFTP